MKNYPFDRNLENTKSTPQKDISISVQKVDDPRLRVVLISPKPKSSSQGVRDYWFSSLNLSRIMSLQKQSVGKTSNQANVIRLLLINRAAPGMLTDMIESRVRLARLFIIPQI
ncbi:hypothetical protein FGO68_gene8536 [Halteria grandinella]|uniref:Uncharacterized protein n=1 Tax=Halteria grandinella TaxID=5974 RepID=A0A8J8NH74_HALGN|nr:hypothetical protein FGO68_gene8536 [Halteria grandinella]